MLCIYTSQVFTSQIFSMTDDAKVMLSEFELMLVSNSEWILTKQRVVQKVGVLLAQQVAVINRDFIPHLIPAVPELASGLPKISKGERYRELPYVILDHPAVFSRAAVFALRTMFWWGNFISVTLHLSGHYKKLLEAVIEKNIVHGIDQSFYISTGNTEWEHHFGEDNYSAVASMNREVLNKKIVQPSFIKIALKYDLSKWDEMNELLPTAYNSFAGLLKP